MEGARHPRVFGNGAGVPCLCHTGNEQGGRQTAGKNSGNAGWQLFRILEDCWVHVVGVGLAEDDVFAEVDGHPSS